MPPYSAPAHPAPAHPAPAPSPPVAAPRPASKQRSYLPLLWVGLAVVVAAAAVVIGMFLGAGGGGTELDVARAEAGVAEILSDPTYGYGANDVGKVVCNEGRNPEVEAGAGFSCDVEVNGNPRRVEVVFTDDAGTYAVDGAR